MRKFVLRPGGSPLRKIVLRLEGGLGNQLFQYAFARQVQQRFGGSVLLDLHTYATDKQRNLSLHHFELHPGINLGAHRPDNAAHHPDDDVLRPNNAAHRSLSDLQRSLNFLLFWMVRVGARIVHQVLKVLPVAPSSRMKLNSAFGIFIQDHPAYEQYLYRCYSPVALIAGNWMSEKFFDTVAAELRQELRLKTPVSEHNVNLLEQIRSTHSVCVHIRRGDYVVGEVKDKTLVCDFDYYQQAIRLLRDELVDPVFYVFSNTSDDIEWIRANYPFDGELRYVDQQNPDYEDFRLMAACKHFVLSNSTYSWWVVYLSESANKRVVAPSRWNNGMWDQSDIYQKDWTLIEV